MVTGHASANLHVGIPMCVLSFGYPFLIPLVVSRHFSLARSPTQALDEARSIARRPMSQSLKDEREEIVVRCHLAKGDVDRAVAETEGSASPGKSFRSVRRICTAIARTNQNGGTPASALHVSDNAQGWRCPYLLFVSF